MVLLVEKLYNSLKHSSKLENHHHHHHDGQSEALSASLQAFRYDASNYLNQLSLSSKPGSQFLSLSWIQQCLDLLSIVNKAFAKLVMDIDYPMSKWDANSIEDYLMYSLKLLELLNSITSSLSHLSQARLSLSHALSLIESSPQSAIERLRAIEFKNLSKDMKVEEKSEERVCSGKEWVVNQALMVMRSNGYWVCGIVLSGLSGDIKPYLEMKKAASKFLSPSLMALDSGFYEAVAEKKWVLKEVNDAAACLVAAMAAGERNDDAGKQLERKLEEMEELLDGMGKETDGMFSEILAGRTELLDSLRNRKP
ncbi:protein BPS1, chloroplastic-like [Camellia sinensis]|uniref:Uncharacterized protein n=1 Tax=Camellia sinensis var. sinensis TaxID=542762 RepID=A0A4S4ENM7_CAMSN|nr:protein BPS1, chloroplastic-like [Camellia sinensis]THG18299.1 hypothetical protein TEA_021600 [Camellia sinensis var. sinensis]